MSKQEQKNTAATRFIYVRDNELTKTGFSEHALARELCDALIAKHSGDELRFKVAHRSRTGLYDVIVKRKREVKS